MPKDSGGRARFARRRRLSSAAPRSAGRRRRLRLFAALRAVPQPTHGQSPRPPPRAAADFSLDPAFSVAQGAALWQKLFCFGLLLGGPLLALLAPLAALAATALCLGGLILGFLALRLPTLPLWGAAPPPPPSRPEEPPQPELLPRISLLIPLYQEARIAPHLLAALEAIDYPQDRLEVLLLLEADDAETREALAALKPPERIRLIVVPPGVPRTKPRALNFGLAEASGAILGVFDAEDRPEADQLRKAAAAFAHAPPDLVCFQARLGWWNARRNVFTRGLALEYAGWFGLLMPGLARRGWPLPLGGTSCYLRTESLRDLGGWDPHNVTEDADLGFRLARRGLRSAALDSTTWEEAVLTRKAWIRQRSRWIKGFLATWIVHMRDPLRLWRELGPAGFFVFNALTLGSFFAYLSLPLHLGALLWLALAGEAPWSGLLPEGLGRALSLLFWAGQGVALAMAAWGAARAYGPRFALWTPILPLYLAALGPVAALRALAQLPRAASLWEKTGHGIDPGLAESPPPPQGRAAPSPAEGRASRGWL